jgi:hypothetical protein
MNELTPSEANVDYQRCPRCHAALFEVGKGALSRTTRDGGAEIEVCPRCGTREGLYGYDPAKQPPITDWPLSPDVLGEEERRLIAQFQQSEIVVATITPGDAARFLDERDDG